MNKHWANAERRYVDLLESYPGSKAAPEALYWRGVCNYKASNDHTVLAKLVDEFNQKYRDSIWAMKAAGWAD